MASNMDGVLDYGFTYDKIDANPLVIMLYEFLNEPKSSSPAYYWALLLSILVAIRYIFIALESVDGPNQYLGREDVSRFYWLFDWQQYLNVYVGIMIPIVLDACIRLITLLCILFDPENVNLKEQILKNYFTLLLFLSDIFGTMAFFITVGYLIPRNIVWEETGRVMLRLIEICLTSKIFRMAKDIPSIWAIRVSLQRSAYHLFVPIFFFFTFNITASVFIFFLEPCYNVNNCPWKNLFDVSFYSVVTMTTTGYGNQVPQFAVGRIIGCGIMVFGALFMSMPLAIIGNSYEEAWSQVNDALAKQRIEKERKDKEKLDLIMRKRPPASKTNEEEKDSNQDLVMKNHMSEIEREAEYENRILRDSPAIITYKLLKNAVEKLTKDCSFNLKLTPVMLLAVCEIRGLMTTLITLLKSGAYFIDNFKNTLNMVQQDQSLKRRLSVFGSNAKSKSEKENEKSGKSVVELKRETREKQELLIRRASVMQGQAYMSSQLFGANKKAMASGSLIAKKAQITDLIPFKNNDPWWKKAISVFTGKSDEKKKRAQSEEFLDRYSEVMNNRDLWKSKLWILLEIPNDSTAGKAVSYFISICIIISVLILYTETMQSLVVYGEDTPLCNMLVGQYCEDKHNYTADPACFAHNGLGKAYRKDNGGYHKVKYGCKDFDCIGYGHNFGASSTNFTCADDGTPPFQGLDSLIYKYNKPLFFTNRVQMQSSNPVCSRLECQDNVQIGNGPSLWILWESFSAFIFTIEIFARVLISTNFWTFIRDKMNIFDILSTVPYYIECINTMVIQKGSFSDLNFSMLPSSPEPIILVFLRAFKIFRLFKLARSFVGSKVLVVTAEKAWVQIVSILSLLFITVVIFSILLFEVESGTACFVGDDDCIVPEGYKDQFHTGDRIVLNKNQALSSFSNVFYGFWFSFVTLTTTGYGDFTPVTNIGQIMAIFIMLAGAFYMAMPLTAAASVFFKAHSEHIENLQHVEDMRKAEDERIEASKKREEAEQGSGGRLFTKKVGVVPVAGTAGPTKKIEKDAIGNTRISKDMVVPLAMRFEDELLQLNLQLIDFLNSLKDDRGVQDDDDENDGGGGASSSFINKSSNAQSGDRKEEVSNVSQLLDRLKFIMSKTTTLLNSELELMKAFAVSSGKAQLDQIQRCLTEQKRKESIL